MAVGGADLSIINIQQYGQHDGNGVWIEVRYSDLSRQYYYWQQGIDEDLFIYESIDGNLFEETIVILVLSIDSVPVDNPDGLIVELDFGNGLENAPSQSAISACATGSNYSGESGYQYFILHVYRDYSTYHYLIGLDYSDCRILAPPDIDYVDTLPGSLTFKEFQEAEHTPMDTFYHNVFYYTYGGQTSEDFYIGGVAVSNKFQW